MRIPRVCAAAVLLASLGCGGGGEATLVLHNAKVFTATADRPWAEAVAVRGDRILAVGSNEEMLDLAGRETAVRDLGGRTVIPGINDAHVHPSSSIETYAIAFTSADPSLDEVIDSLRAVTSRLAPERWLVGSIGGTVFDDPRATLDFLDRIAPAHPLMFSGWTGHSRLLNTAGWRALVDDAGLTAEGLGGWGEARSDGSMRGILHGYAALRATERLERDVDSISIASFEAFSREVSALGITSVQHMAYPFTAAKTLALLQAAPPSIRWRIIHFPRTALDREELASAPATLPSNVELGGVKWVSDGTPEERMMAVRTPYRDRPTWRGQYYLTDAELRAAVRGTVEREQQLLVHAVGDAALLRLFDVMEELSPPEQWQVRRPRVEHGDGLLPDLLDQVEALGIVVVQNPSHLTLSGLLDRRLRPGTREHFQPLRSLVEAGIPLALGSDGPLNPFLNMMFAVLHPGNPSEALTREQAVVAYTRGSAFAEFKEAEKGTLEPGKLADLAVLSQDIFTVPLEALPVTTSEFTLVGGRVVHASGEFR